MSKSSWPFGSKSGPRGAVTMVQVSVEQSAARRALIAFWLFTFGGLAVGAAAAVGFARSQPVLDVVAGLTAGVAVGLIAAVLVRVWTVVRVLWHWALELSLVGGVALGWSTLANALSSLAAGLVVLALVGVGAMIGPVRRLVVAAVWCVIVRHRLRLCFAEFIRTPGRNNLGSPPLMLWARPTPAGERVWVWLRPGLDLSDLEGRFGKLAVACWANEVRAVRASRRFAALLRIDVARRDPLVAIVPSPLPNLVPASFTSAFQTPDDVVPMGLDLPDVPDPVDEPSGRSDRSPSRPSRGTRTTPPPAEPQANEYDAFI